VKLALLAACVLAVSRPSGAAKPPDGVAIARAAREQVGRTTCYDPAYRTLRYPNGDVPLECGVCTDVVIRALRSSLGMDLQALVHEDMKQHFAAYPQTWGLATPDCNIDHRRVPNLRTFFARKGWKLPVSRRAADYAAGDLVTCIVPPDLPHIMVVSDRTNADGQPLIIHNIGGGVHEEDLLFALELTGHYRIRKVSGEDASEGE
jgi:uncharacterized protein YijF (DUF1287 family)